ncbi:putative sulfate exporter family transporter, partial [Levilactobacillus brevis]|nr:putative sulfate exporter family transporter [Levilactobacillus brevis]
MSVNFRVIFQRGGNAFLAATLSSVVLLAGVTFASKLFF